MEASCGTVIRKLCLENRSAPIDPSMMARATGSTMITRSHTDMGEPKRGRQWTDTAGPKRAKILAERSTEVQPELLVQQAAHV
jgi:hypothetical protein